MKKLFTLLLFAALLCSLCITGFAEESNSHEKLLEYVPYAAYTGQTETIETQGVSYCTLRIFYKELKQQGLIPSDMKSIDREPSKEALLSFPQVSVEDVCKTFDRLFGPNASRLLKIDEAESGKPILDSMSEQLYLSEDKKTFYYVPLSYGGGYYTLPYGRLFRSEVIGEDLCLYVRMVYTSIDNDRYFWLYETFKSQSSLIYYRCDDWDKLGVNPWEMLDNGELDEYLPVYKHTFKPNGDGTYYWASTVKESDGKQIPLSVIDPSAEERSITPEDLMLQIPSYAHTGEKESILTVSTGDIINQSTSSIFFYGLQRDGLIPKTVEPFNAPPTKEQLAACPKVSAADIEKTFTRLFGPDAVARFCGKDSYSTRGHLILTRLEDGSYAYYDYSFGGGDGPGAWTNYVRSETVGEDIVLYATFAYGTLGGYDSCWISETVDDGGKALLSVPKENLEKRAADPFKMLKTGAFDEYLPIYKHTFKPNGDGTYYWAHTELDTAGKEIPLSLIEEEEQYLHSLVTTVPKEAYRGSVTTPNYQSHSKLTSSQLYEDKLYISESYAEWTVEGTSLTLYSPRGNKANADKQIVLGTWENVSPDKNQASIEGLIRDEKFVQYYTNYRHTFVKNAYGSYSWVETIVNRYGETMPVALTGGSSNSNTDSTASTTYTATDVSTNTTDVVTDVSTGTATDVSTGSATDVVPQEEGSSAVWIVVAVVAVAAVAVGAVLLWNKKK